MTHERSMHRHDASMPEVHDCMMLQPSLSWASSRRRRPWAEMKPDPEVCMPIWQMLGRARSAADGSAAGSAMSLAGSNNEFLVELGEEDDPRARAGHVGGTLYILYIIYKIVRNHI